MTDYWKFGATERFVLFAAFLIQWILVTLVTLQVMHQHGTMTTNEAQEFAQQFELFGWLIIGALVLGFIGMPAIRALPDGYRYIRQTAGAYL